MSTSTTAPAKRSPSYKWADDDDTVFITVSVSATNCAVRVTRDEISVDSGPYALRLLPAQPLDPARSAWSPAEGGRALVIRAVKAAPTSRWTALQKPGIPKPLGETVDWDRARIGEDEEDEDEEGLNEKVKEVKRQLTSHARRVATPRTSSSSSLPRLPRVEVWDLVVLASFLAHLAVAPFTKVEESFGMQAAHDFLFLGPAPSALSRWDHQEFPGVVPRTFAGPAVLAALSYPAAFALRTIGSRAVTKLAVGFVVRGTLGLLVAVAFGFFRRAVTSVFGRRVGAALAVVTAVQFHFPFYATRTLPNTFALIVVLVALAFYCKGRIIACGCSLVVACTVFRCDVVVLAAPLLVYPLFVKAPRLLPRAVVCALATAVVSLLLTVPMDSYLWGRPLWPESSVLLFNTVDNRSSEWGVMAWHWYFSNAFPRALSLTALLAAAGFLLDSRRLSPLVLPAVAFVALYSVLPHKELRFVVYAVPMLNLAAAVALAKAWESRRWLLRLVVAGLLLGTLGTTALFALASAHNYPGARALIELHKMEAGKTYPHNVHIDVAAAQTGITRFGESSLHNWWRYNKTEGLRDWSDFTHLITERSRVPGFVHVGQAEKYAGLDLRPAALHKLFVRTSPYIHILRKQ